MRVLGTFLVGSVSAILGALAAFVVLSVYYLDARPDLQIWHETRLHSEYTATAPARTFAHYLELESRLFGELDERVYSQMKVRDTRESVLFLSGGQGRRIRADLSAGRILRCRIRFARTRGCANTR